MSASPSPPPPRHPEPAVPGTPGTPGTPGPPGPPGPAGEDAPYASAREPRSRSRHGGGNWRSLVVSMIVLLAFVLAWLALTPRVDRVARPSVDVAASARTMAEQHGWRVLVPRPGEQWRPTSVSYDPSRSGMRVWHVGYHEGAAAERYIAVDQGRTSGGDRVRDAWVSETTAYGAPAGATTVDGRRWERFTASGSVTRHSLVRRGAGDEPTIVVTGIADPQQIEAAAASLEPYAAG